MAILQIALSSFLIYLIFLSFCVRVCVCAARRSLASVGAVGPGDLDLVQE